MIYMIMSNQAKINISRIKRQNFIILAVLPFLEKTTVNNKFDCAVVWLLYDNQIA